MTLPIDSLTLTTASTGRRHTSVRSAIQDGLKELAGLGLLVTTVGPDGLTTWTDPRGNLEARESLYVDSTGRRAVLVLLTPGIGRCLILKGRHEGDRQALAAEILKHS